MIEYIKLIRPPLFLLGFIASWGLLVKSGLWRTPESLLILLAVGFGNGAFVVFNEICDVGQDRINKPWKPLPSGKVSVFRAKLIAFTFYIISLISLIMLLIYYDIRYVLVGIVGYVTGAIYNVLGRRDVVGNSCLGSTYAVAGFMSTGLTDLAFPLAFGLLTVAHNIMVQVQDLEADRKAGVLTLPQQVYSPYLELIVAVLSAVSFLMFLQIKQPVFAVAVILILMSVFVKQHIEALIRYGVRLLILIGFVLMGAGLWSQGNVV